MEVVLDSSEPTEAPGGFNGDVNARFSEKEVTMKASYINGKFAVGSEQFGGNVVINMPNLKKINGTLAGTSPRAA